MLRYIPWLVGSLIAVCSAVNASEMCAIQSLPSGILSYARDSESDAAAAYQAFSRRAEQESYAGVRSLFDALAFSERVHERNHQRSLKRMGVSEPATVAVPEDVEGTHANLQRAAEGERLAWRTHYPELIAQAQDAKVWEPLRAMRQIKIVESKHYSLIRAMLADPARWTQQQTYAVCSRCGYVAEEMIRDSCPVCQAERNRFALVG